MVQQGPKTPKNAKSRGYPKTFSSLVTTKEIPRYSCKISGDCLKFLKALRNIPKKGQKYHIILKAEE